MDDKDIEFEIELAKSGMRFGARIAVAVALFATGVTMLLTTVDLYIQHIDAKFLVGRWIAGGLLILGGLVVWYLSQYWTLADISKLKKDHMAKTEKIPGKKTSRESHRPSFWLSKTHDGIVIC